MSNKPTIYEKKYLVVKHIVDALIKDDVQIVKQPGWWNSKENFSLKKFLCLAMCEGVSSLNWKMINALVEKCQVEDAVSFDKEFGRGIQQPKNSYKSYYNYDELRTF